MRSQTATASKPPGASQHAPTASGRQRDVDDAVDVVEREHEDDPVVRRPPPRRRPSRRSGRRGCPGCARRPSDGRSSRSCRSSAPAARAAAPSGGRRRARRRRRRRSPARRRRAPATSRWASEAMTAAAPLSSSAYCSSASGCCGWSGTAIAPACQQASRATTKSWPGVQRMATRSPGSYRAVQDAGERGGVPVDVGVRPRPGGIDDRQRGRRSGRPRLASASKSLISAAATARPAQPVAGRRPPARRRPGSTSTSRAGRTDELDADRQARRRRSRPAATAPGSPSR